MAGRPRTVDDSTLLREIRLAPDPIVTAPELADRVGMTRQGVTNRLEGLVEQDYVVRRGVGARAVVYWLTPAGREVAAASSDQNG